MKAVNIIFAILAIIAAVICFVVPLGATIMYGYIVAAYIGALGLVSIITFIASPDKNRALIGNGIVGLILGIIGLLFFVFNISIPGFNLGVETMIAWFFLIIIAIVGFTTIINGIKAVRTNGAGTVIILILLGLLVLGAAIWGMMNITYVLSFFGIFLGVCFAVTSVSLLVNCFK